MPIPDLDTLNERALRALEKLSQVKLNYFTATPENLGPFGTSILRWDVENVQTNVRITLGNQQVQMTGDKTVTPTRTQTYRLIAQLFEFTLPLGTVTITVNQDACIVAPSLSNIENELEILIKNGLEDSPEFKGFYFPDDWKMDVQITNNNIFYKLSFMKDVNCFPDATVTLSADFGIVAERDDKIAVIRTRPKAVVFAEHSKVSVPFWAWWIPGAIPLLAIALGGAKDQAAKKSRDLCQIIADTIVSIDRVGTPIPSGYQLHHMNLYETEGGNGNADAVYCPAQPVSA